MTIRHTGYAAWGLPDADGRWATFGLPYTTTRDIPQENPVTTNLDRFLTSDEHNGRCTYRFPNGVDVSVIPDPHGGFRWEILATVGPKQSADHHRLDPGGLAAGLSTDEAEALLADLANLPRAD